MKDFKYEYKNYVPASVRGEICVCCMKKPAARKVQETIYEDDPMFVERKAGNLLFRGPGRHPYTTFLCLECFASIMGAFVSSSLGFSCEKWEDKKPKDISSDNPDIGGFGFF